MSGLVNAFCNIVTYFLKCMILLRLSYSILLPFMLPHKDFLLMLLIFNTLCSYESNLKWFYVIFQLGEWKQKIIKYFAVSGFFSLAAGLKVKLDPLWTQKATEAISRVITSRFTYRFSDKNVSRFVPVIDQSEKKIPMSDRWTIVHADFVCGFSLVQAIRWCSPICDFEVWRRRQKQTSKQ